MQGDRQKIFAAFARQAAKPTNWQRHAAWQLGHLTNREYAVCLLIDGAELWETYPLLELAEAIRP